MSKTEDPYFVPTCDCDCGCERGLFTAETREAEQCLWCRGGLGTPAC